MIGTLLNERYRLDAELGRGGMGIGTCSKWWWRFFAHWNFYEHLVV